MFDPIDRPGCPLVKHWQHDRELRQRVPRREAWRGCLGLGVLCDEPDGFHAFQGFTHGNRYLLRNDALRWLAIRDVPVGYFAKSLGPREREVNYASITKAKLRYGLPYLSFADDNVFSCDFRFCPLPGGLRDDPWECWNRDALDSEAMPREFDVFNRISAAMTDFAFGAADRHGRPLRPAWQSQRLPGIPTSRVRQPGEWMPEPLLGFGLEEAELLYAEVTKLQLQGVIYLCPCGAMNESNQFRDPHCQLESAGIGCFNANCPRCGVRRYWSDDESTDPLLVPWSSTTLSQKFCHALSLGLPLETPCSSVYLGAEQVSRRSPIAGAPSGWLSHRFAWSGGQESVVLLPPSAQVLCNAGDELPAGNLWAKAFPQPSIDWRRLNWRNQQRALSDVCGGASVADFLRRLWFHHEAVYLEEMPDLVFYPASLVSAAASEIRPSELLWDFARARKCFEESSGIAVLPPIPLQQWDDLRINTESDWFISASIADPRLMVEPPRRMARCAEPRPGRRKATSVRHGSMHHRSKELAMTA